MLSVVHEHYDAMLPQYVYQSFPAVAPMKSFVGMVAAHKAHVRGRYNVDVKCC